MASSKNHWSTLAAYTVAVAATLGGAADAAGPQTLQQLDRYCQASWRNAGIDRQEWDDCTQQVVTDLLDKTPANDSQAARHEDDTSPHRELKRAVWRTIKRWQRRPQAAALDVSHVAVDSVDRRQSSDEWDEVETTAKDCLTPRQWEVMRLSREGWTVSEIAERLETSAARVSDLKYRAISKLKERLA